MEVGGGVDSATKSQRRVGLLYDERMCKHSTPDGDPHPENPDRIKVIWNKLQANSIPQRYTTFFIIIQLFCVALKLSRKTKKS